MNRKVLEEALRSRPERTLYHYTNQAGLLGIVRTRQIWATHTQYLNDTREFLHALQMVREELFLLSALHGDWISRLSMEIAGRTLPESLPSNDAARGVLADMSKALGEEGRENMNVCVASFSEVCDSLSQWRAYAPQGGFCLGIRGQLLADMVLDHAFYIAPCVYNRNEQRALVLALIEEVLEENIKHLAHPDSECGTRPLGGNLIAYLNRFAPMLKDPSFAEEREWRIITRPQMCSGSRFDFREGKSMLVPFYRFPLDGEGKTFPLEEVVVGPTPNPERAAASVRSFLVSQGLKSVMVKCSAVPYRNW